MSTPEIDRPTMTADDLARREHDRRERAWCPAARWQAIQETIRWAEAQANARRNTPAACIAQERRRR
ncbi:MAG: hypothetical protein EBX35_03810 [Planctomycetia bacterium]|jgi:hypothetical protein|nr:hypothetical protein [Planctomycetia bacterium]